MAHTTRLLAVANVTAVSDALLDALRERAREAPLRVTLLVPAGGTEHAAAEEQLARALRRMRQAGLAADGRVGPPDPVVAVHEVWSPGDFDEIVVSTLPSGSSRWLQLDLPHRIERLTDARVTHVEVPAESPPEPHVEQVERSPRPRLGLLTPLEALWDHGRSRPA
jgi:sugar phosphate isomerase/epimerase